MIKRKLFEDLKKHLDKKEISFIAGPRQAGKTTLMLLLREHLNALGEKSVFLNLDSEEDRKYFSSQLSLIGKIELEIGKGGGFVFIDEIQRKENAGLFLKGLYDQNLPWKFIVSGSGSVELKESLHESLAGRKRIFELDTLSFLEFVNYKTGYRYENSFAEFFNIEKNLSKSFLKEYMAFGGYPAVVLSETEAEKRKMISEIYQSYVERDIENLLGIKKQEEFTMLFRVVAGQAGNIVNYSELSNTMGISQKTVRDYLWYMQKTFMVDKITPFFRNIRKEITKAPTYYFRDLGMRNFALGSFNPTVVDSSQAGFLFQNFIYLVLKEKLKDSSATIQFWRTTDGAEVDFVVDSGLEVVPCEVKYSFLKSFRISRSYRSFILKHKPKKGYLISLGECGSSVFEGTEVLFVPYETAILKDIFGFNKLIP